MLFDIAYALIVVLDDYIPEVVYYLIEPELRQLYRRFSYLLVRRLSKLLEQAD